MVFDLRRVAPRSLTTPRSPLQRLRRRPRAHAGQQLRLVPDLAGGAEIAADVPADGAGVVAVAVTEPVGVGGDDLDVERGTPSSSATSCAYGLLAVGLGRQAQDHLAGRVHPQEHRAVSLIGHGWISPPRCAARMSASPARESLALLVGAQRVVLLQVAESRRRTAKRVRRHRRAVAAGVDAGLGRRLVGLIGRSRSTPASCCRGSGRSRSASRPSCRGPASRCPTAPRPRLGAGPALRNTVAARRARDRDRLDHLVSASRLWPLTSASTVRQRRGHAAGRARANASALARGLTHTIRCARRARRSISLADERGVAALPAVGEDHDHRAAGHAAPAVAVVEGLSALADPRAARPVRRGCGARVWIARSGLRERARRVSARQPRREHERLGVGRRAAAQVRNCR